MSSIYVWTCPMGFETLFVWRILGHLLSLNMPYGIWNSSSLILRLEPPLKFEHALWDLKLNTKTDVPVRSKKFEHALWDLKLAHQLWQLFKLLVWTCPMGFETILFCGTSSNCVVWTCPMGFETVSQQTQSFLHTFVWTCPMGFETHPRRLAAYQKTSLNMPYGIWNCTDSTA